MNLHRRFIAMNLQNRFILYETLKSFVAMILLCKIILKLQSIKKEDEIHNRPEEIGF